MRARAYHASVRAPIFFSSTAALVVATAALGDTTLPAPAPARPAPSDDEPACGSAAWKTMVRGLERWCQTEKHPDAVRGCRYVLPLARRCDRKAVAAWVGWRSSGDQGRDGVVETAELRFAVRDPRNQDGSWRWRSDLDGRNLQFWYTPGEGDL
jgi:hypothetical protein